MSQNRLTIAAIVLMATTALIVIGQTKSFDVVSIKTNNSGNGFLRIGGQPAAGRFVASNVTVEQLIIWANRIQNYQLSGGPGWIRTETFDIEGRSDEGALTGALPPDQMAQMVQSLLTGRFNLKMHRARTEGSVYTLVIARNGLKMKRSTDQTASTGPGPRGGGGRGQRGDGPPPRGGARMAPGYVEASGVSMAMLTGMLGQQLGRPVLDKTNLEGLFDIQLEWATDPNFPGPRGPGGVRGPDIGASATGPSLFTAVEEQLGLKLEQAKGPIDTFVIDRVDRPAQN